MKAIKIKSDEGEWILNLDQVEVAIRVEKSIRFSMLSGNVIFANFNQGDPSTAEELFEDLWEILCNIKDDLAKRKLSR